MNIIKEELQFEESLKGNKGFMCQYDKSLNFETVWSSIFEKFGENSAIVYITQGIIISYIDILIFHRNHELLSSTSLSFIYLAIVLIVYMILFRILKRGKMKNEQRN